MCPVPFNLINIIFQLNIFFRQWTFSEWIFNEFISMDSISWEFFFHKWRISVNFLSVMALFERFCSASFESREQKKRWTPFNIRRVESYFNTTITRRCNELLRGCAATYQKWGARAKKKLLKMKNAREKTHWTTERLVLEWTSKRATNKKSENKRKSENENRNKKMSEWEGKVAESKYRECSENGREGKL